MGEMQRNIGNSATVEIMSASIERCAGCTGECHEPYRRTAVELLMMDDKSLKGSERAEDKERVLQFRMSKIIGCTLGRVEITTNLEGLMEGTLSLNGR
jgi:hypothetical protein